MTKALSQAMIFFLAVLFVLSLALPMIAHYQKRPGLKKAGIGCMVGFSLLLAACLLGWFGSL